MTDIAAPRTRNGFKLAIICALKLEAESVRSVFDKCWDDEGQSYGKATGDKNTYTTGVISGHNVVMTLLPKIGGIPAGWAAAGLSTSFPNVELVLIVGICGVVPFHPETKEEIVLGDVIISTDLVQYDYGRMYPSGFQRKSSVEDTLRKAPTEIRGFMNKLSMRQSHTKLKESLAELVNDEEFLKDELTARYPGESRDQLYEATYLHQHRPPEKCSVCHEGLDGICAQYCDTLGCGQEKLIARTRHDNPHQFGPAIHLGRFGSSNSVMRSGIDRDRIANAEKLIAFEMEGAGVWDEHPTIVIKGACDYADSHKNKIWQPYAAMMAAACLKLMLKQWIFVDELAASETIWYMPFDKTSNFIGRRDELIRLKQKVFDKDSRRRVSILGLGGIGKSRLAQELAYQIRLEQPHCSVFWVQAQNQLTFEDDLRKIGIELGIPGIEDEKGNFKNIVKKWLSKAAKNHWVLILDNADDEELWGRERSQQQPSCSLVDYLPRTTYGSIVITTRVRSIATFLTGKEVVELAEMTPTEAAEMFVSGLEKVELCGNQGEIRDLVDKLVYLPLAILQASSYVNQTQETPRKYLQLLDQTEEHVIELLTTDIDEPFGHSRSVEPVATTWLISFQHIRDRHPLAATYLSQMACLHEKNIPLSLLLKESVNNMTQAFAVLVGYSFVRRNEKKRSANNQETFYDMHRLVRLCTRNWLRSDGKLIETTIDCLKQVLEVYPRNSYPSKDLWSTYLPHAELLCVDEHVRHIPERYELLERIANCFDYDGKFTKYTNILKEVLQWNKQQLGPTHPDTLKVMARLGHAFVFQNDPPLAMVCLQSALNGFMAVLGREHRLTLNTMNDLAQTYLVSGQYEKAEKLSLQLVEIGKRVLGTEDNDTIQFIRVQASIYSAQGKYSEAENLQKELILQQQNIHGTENPDMLATVSDLAFTYVNQKRYEEAESIYVALIETSKRLLGKEHPDTLLSMFGLALMYLEAHRFEESEQLWKQTLSLQKRMLGDDNHIILRTMGNLARALKKQEKYNEAEEIGADLLEKRERIYGKEHPDTLRTMQNLAYIRFCQGRKDEAVAMMKNCVVGFERLLGPKHQITQASLGVLREMEGSSNLEEA